MLSAVNGALASRKSTYLPNFTDTFEQGVAHYNLVKDFVFGTGVVAAPGQTLIDDLTDLAVNFQPRSNNAGGIRINKEWQFYPNAFNNTNHHLSSDALELTATLDPTTYTVQTKNPTSNVTYNRTVPVADTSDVKVGQVVGLGAEQYANIHRTRLIRVVGTPANGDTTQIVFTPVGTPTPWGPVTIVATAGPSTTLAQMASDMVSQINANATLQAQKVTAFLLPESPGCYAVTYPKVPLDAVKDYGNEGKGSLLSVGLSLTKTGGAGITAYQVYQNVYQSYVVSKTANSVTLNHPVTVTTSSVLTFSPTYCYHCSVDSFNTATLPIADTTGITLLQTVQLSYQDNNLRRINSKTSNSITLSAAVYAGASLLITVLPVHAAVTTAATAADSNIVTFAAVPEGVLPGMEMYNFFASGPVERVKVLSKTATTVTLDQNRSCANGDTMIFYPPIDSGQIWSKFRFMPSDPLIPGRTMIAMSLKCKIPDAAALANWPAWWMFTDTADPDPTPGGSGNSEIDIVDLFTYWNNDSTNRFNPAQSNPFTQLYAHPDYSGSLLGNNAGSKERTIGFIWKNDRLYFYLDGVLIRSVAMTWNNYKRAQFAANLAVGSMNTSFHSNGFYPIDYSQFPMKFTIKQWKVWFAPTDQTFAIG